MPWYDCAASWACNYSPAWWCVYCFRGQTHVCVCVCVCVGEFLWQFWEGAPWIFKGCSLCWKTFMQTFISVPALDSHQPSIIISNAKSSLKSVWFLRADRLPLTSCSSTLLLLILITQEIEFNYPLKPDISLKLFTFPIYVWMHGRPGVWRTSYKLKN